MYAHCLPTRSYLNAECFRRLYDKHLAKQFLEILNTSVLADVKQKESKYKLNKVQPAQGKASQSSCAQLCLKILNSAMRPRVSFINDSFVSNNIFHDVMSKMTRTWTMHFFGVRI